MFFRKRLKLKDSKFNEYAYKLPKYCHRCYILLYNTKNSFHDLVQCKLCKQSYNLDKNPNGSVALWASLRSNLD